MVLLHRIGQQGHAVPWVPNKKKKLLSKKWPVPFNDNTVKSQVEDWDF